MAANYAKLWKLLIDKNINRTALREKSGISLKYLNSLFSREDDDEISEKAIGFRNEIALFVSRINGVTAGNRFFGLFEKMKSKINA